MGNILLFAAPRVEPPPVEVLDLDEFGHLSARAMDHLRQLQQKRRELHTGIVERAAIVAQAFGMPHLARMNASEASNALVQLTKRPDVCAVLDAYWRQKAVAQRKAG